MGDNKEEGIYQLTTETGAGQWGAPPSPSLAAQFGIKCKVYMVKISYQQKPYRRSMMHVWGGEVTPSPSNETKCKETGEEKCILFNFSEHGLCDLGSYDRYFAGELEDFAYPLDRIEAALAELPVID